MSICRQAQCGGVSGEYGPDQPTRALHRPTERKEAAGELRRVEGKGVAAAVQCRREKFKVRRGKRARSRRTRRRAGLFFHCVFFFFFLMREGTGDRGWGPWLVTEFHCVFFFFFLISGE